LGPARIKALSSFPDFPAFDSPVSTDWRGSAYYPFIDSRQFALYPAPGNSPERQINLNICRHDFLKGGDNGQTGPGFPSDTRYCWQFFMHLKVTAFQDGKHFTSQREK
jgi:hypothetical protein